MLPSTLAARAALSLMCLLLLSGPSWADQVTTQSSAVHIGREAAPRVNPPANWPGNDSRLPSPFQLAQECPWDYPTLCSGRCYEWGSECCMNGAACGSNTRCCGNGCCPLNTQCVGPGYCIPYGAQDCGGGRYCTSGHCCNNGTACCH